MHKLALTMLTLAACAEPDPARTCPPLETMAVSNDSGLPDVLTEDDVKLRAHLARPDDVTVYGVTVAGVAAKDEGDNFRIFSVTITAADIARVSSEADGLWNLPVQVETNCGPATLAASIDIPAAEPPPPVTLELTLGVPADGYAPVAVVVPVAVTVTADADAAGTNVALSTTVGTFVGGANAMLVLTADGDDGSAASTYLLPASGVSGKAIVTARSGDAIDTGEVTFLGPPSIIPPSGPVSRGETVAVIVRPTTVDGVTGELESCRAVAPTDVAVSSGSIDLVESEGITVESDGDGLVTVVISANAVLDRVVHLSCRDVHGQAASASYTVKP